MLSVHDSVKEFQFMYSEAWFCISVCVCDGSAIFVVGEVALSAGTTNSVEIFEGYLQAFSSTLMFCLLI